MTGAELSPHYLIGMKLAAYQRKHGGKRPARIFVSDSVLMKIVGDDKCRCVASVTGGGELFGVPMVVINDGGDAVYLSDEEE